MKASPVAKAAIIIAVFLTLSACDIGKQRTQNLIDSFNLNRRETLALSMAQPPLSLDWNLATDPSSLAIEGNIMSGLTSYEMHGREAVVVPELAEKWEVSEGGLKYVFKLHEGLRWTDGEPVRAQNFVDSIQRILSSNSPWAENYFVLRNAKSFAEGKTKNFGEVGIRATDDRTLVFQLKDPLAYFPGVFSHPSSFPIRKDLIEKHRDKWWSKENIVTVGPYRLAEEKTGKVVLLRQNERYSLHKPLLKNVLFRFGLSSADELQLFSSGQINAVVEIPPEDLKAFQNLDELAYVPLLDVTYLTFDMRRKPVSNPIFRRIVAMNIDREELTHALQDVVKPTGGFIPPGLPGYESNRGVRFDPDMAHQVMKNSGYLNLSKYEPFYLKLGAAPMGAKAAENVAAQLKRGVGVNVKVVKLADEVPKDAPVIIMTHWLATVPDAHNFLSQFSSDYNKNPTGWKNRNFDEFTRQSLTASSLEAKEKLYAKAQHILTETEMPVIPLYISNEFSLVQKKLRNFPINVMGTLSFRGVSFE